jgi:hypothetical protein
MATPRLTDEIIDAAILGFEEQRRRLDAQLAELRAMRAGESRPAASSSPRRKMSAAGRKAIAEAQRQRWAALKGGATPEKAPKKAPKKAKRKLSAAGRAAIVAALKKRWAAKKSAAKS